MSDLIVLAADNEQSVAIATLLTARHTSLAIRPISCTIARHPGSDGGVYKGAGDFLSVFRGQYAHALVIIDLEWGGSPGDAEAIRRNIGGQLTRTGWTADSFEIIVIEPELEAWVWARDNPHVAKLLGVSWEDIYACAARHSYWHAGTPKPQRPKELLERLARDYNARRRDAGLYKDLATRVGLAHCTDPSFRLLKETLARWFP